MSPERRAKGGLGCPVSHPEHGDTLNLTSYHYQILLYQLVRSVSSEKSTESSRPGMASGGKADWPEAGKYQADRSDKIMFSGRFICARPAIPPYGVELGQNLSLYPSHMGFLENPWVAGRATHSPVASVYG
ncbi:MAG: hypothetical protein [Olavius algarvensis Gamma 1 endosymbiont]|nr:MAG: hypothetical protein [Olavius algarvensis Gamma 1 endosymbiont]